MIGQRPLGKLSAYKQPKPRPLYTTHSKFTCVVFHTYFASNKRCLYFTILVSLLNSFFREDKDQGPSSNCSITGIGIALFQNPGGLHCGSLTGVCQSPHCVFSRYCIPRTTGPWPKWLLVPQSAPAAGLPLLWVPLKTSPLKTLLHLRSR